MRGGGVGAIPLERFGGGNLDLKTRGAGSCGCVSVDSYPKHLYLLTSSSFDGITGFTSSADSERFSAYGATTSSSHLLTLKLLLCW